VNGQSASVLCSGSAAAPQLPATQAERSATPSAMAAVTIAQGKAERPGIVRCRGGLLVQPHHTLADHPPLDLVVVPGGFGTRRERGNPVVLRWIERQHAGGVLTTSVCTGAFLLAATGLLNGRAATTHWASIDGLRRAHPAVAVRADERIVDQGQVVTSAGVSAGIDMALHVVRRQHGEAVARATARDMEYDWAG